MNASHLGINLPFPKIMSMQYEKHIRKLMTIAGNPRTMIVCFKKGIDSTTPGGALSACLFPCTSLIIANNTKHTLQIKVNFDKNETAFMEQH